MKKQVGVHGSSNDNWLTPLALIQALGPFTTDPCCTKRMPWKTAKYMFSEAGLEKKWVGRIWLNPPYSKARPWVEKFVAHGKGIALVSAKSTDSRWAQHLLKHCDSALWLASPRIHFYHPTGVESDGAFLSNLLVAMTPSDTKKLQKLKLYSGVLFRRVTP